MYISKNEVVVRFQSEKDVFEQTPFSGPSTILVSSSFIKQAIPLYSIFATARVLFCL